MRYLLKLRSFLLALLLLGLALPSHAQTGDEFWFDIPEINRGHTANGPIKYFLHVAALDYPVRVTLELPAEQGFTPLSFVLQTGEEKRLELAAGGTNFTNPASPLSLFYKPQYSGSGTGHPGPSLHTATSAERPKYIENLLAWAESDLSTPGKYYINRTNKGVRMRAEILDTVWKSPGLIRLMDYRREKLLTINEEYQGVTPTDPLWSTYRNKLITLEQEIARARRMNYFPGTTTVSPGIYHDNWDLTSPQAPWTFRPRNEPKKLITSYIEISTGWNMDLIALKGDNAKGRRFFVPMQTHYSNSDSRYDSFRARPYASFNIVATADDTKVRVKTPRPIFARSNSMSYGGTQVTQTQGKALHEYELYFEKAGQSCIIVPYGQNSVNGGDSYQYYPGTEYSNSDVRRLQGSQVEVVNGGEVVVLTREDIVFPHSGNPDYVADQLIPESLFGQYYGLLQGDVSGSPPYHERIYVVASQDNTTVTLTRLDGTTQEKTVNKGEQADFLIDNTTTERAVNVTATKPVILFQMSGSSNGNASQRAGAVIPAMPKATGVCVGSKEVVFSRAKGGGYKMFLNLVAWDFTGTPSAIGNFELHQSTGGAFTRVQPGTAGKILEDKINAHASWQDFPGSATDPQRKWKWFRAETDAIAGGAITTGVTYKLLNRGNVFQLGVLNGDPGRDAFFGYFSDFAIASGVEHGIQPEVIDPQTGQSESIPGSDIAYVPYGGSVHLKTGLPDLYKFRWSAEGGVGEDKILSPNAADSWIIQPQEQSKYLLEVTGFCNVTTTRRVELRPIFPKSTVTFDLNGGRLDGQTSIKPVTLGDLQELEPPKGEYTKAGFTFAFWAKQGETVPYNFAARRPSDLHLVAQWKRAAPAMGTVTFDANGGRGAPMPVNVVQGGPMDDLFPRVIPRREGFRFLGWSKGSSAVNADFTKDTPVTENVTVYAVWELDPKAQPQVGQFTVGIEQPANGSIRVAMVQSPATEITDGMSLPQGTRILIAAEARSGHRVSRLLVNGEVRANPYTVEVVEDLKISAEVVAAGGKLVQYTVTFDLDGGRLDGQPAVQLQTVNEGARASDPGRPTRPGHRFLGWYSGEDRYSFREPLVSDLRLVARWKVLPPAVVRYTVTFDANGGQGAPAPQRVESGKSLGASFPSQQPTHGYAFGGWARSSTASKADFTADTPVTEDITVYAVWTLVPRKGELYPVHFKQPPHGRIVVRMLQSPAWTIFYSGMRVPKGTRLQIMTTADAGYVVSKLLVNGAEQSNPVTLLVEKGMQIVAEIVPQTTAPVQHAVTFDLAGGRLHGLTVVPLRMVNDEGFVADPGEPVKPGYSFLGWYDGGVRYEFPTKVKGALHLQARWEPLPVTPSYTLRITQPNHGAIVVQTMASPLRELGDGDELPLDTRIRIAATASKGYRLKRLYVNDMPEESPHILGVTGDVYVRAEMEQSASTPIPTVYTVVFDANGGAGAPSSRRVASGKSLEGEFPGEEPTREGFRFLGWATSSTATEADFTSSTAVTGDLIVYAVWQLQSAPGADWPTIRFTQPMHGKLSVKMLQGPAKGIASGEKVPKGSWILIEPTAAEGYKVSKLVVNGEERPFPQTMRAERDLDILAEVVAKTVPLQQHRVTFDQDGGKLYGMPPVFFQMVNDGAYATDPGSPIRPGYEFQGWYDGGTKHDFPSMKVTADLRLVARWEVTGGTPKAPEPEAPRPEDSIQSSPDTPVLASGRARLVLQPNPATDFIRLEGLSGGAKVHIYSPLGAILQTVDLAPGQGLDVRNLRPGIYLLRVGRQTLRFVRR